MCLRGNTVFNYISALWSHAKCLFIVTFISFFSIFLNLAIRYGGIPFRCTITDGVWLHGDRVDGCISIIFNWTQPHQLTVVYGVQISPGREGGRQGGREGGRERKGGKEREGKKGREGGRKKGVRGEGGREGGREGRREGREGR